MKQDENTINYNAEKLELVSNTNVVTKKILQKIVAKVVRKNNTITVAGQIFVKYEKQIDSSNQIYKSYEDLFRDNKIKKIF